jgi:tetratricopeptide (TPR) repeat protein
MQNYLYGGTMLQPMAVEGYFPDSWGKLREKYLINHAIRTLLGGDSAEALAMVNGLFNAGGPGELSFSLSPETYRFGGEFFYDHGNFLRAAEIFSYFTDDAGLARQGDALWLAGFAGSARTMWLAVSGSEEGSAEIRSRVLYNLASTVDDAREAGRQLERLFAQNSSYEPGSVFGAIRYSRLVPPDRALSILERTDQAEGLFDLELLRRRSEGWTVDRTIAETWLLLNRHPNDGRLFEWAAWYFDFQRRYDETALALRNAGINRVEGPWSAIHRAYANVRENRLDEAEKLLRGITRGPDISSGSPGVAQRGLPAGAGSGRRQQPLWQASADLGLLLDKRRSPQEALGYYEIAAGLLDIVLNYNQPQETPAGGQISPETRDAARVQLLIARDLRALGRERDSRRALEYGLDLDPDNLQVRLELRRLENQGIF